MYELDTYMPASVIYLHLCTEMAEIGVIEDTCRQSIVAYVSIIFCCFWNQDGWLLALSFSAGDTSIQHF